MIFDSIFWGCALRLMFKLKTGLERKELEIHDHLYAPEQLGRCLEKATVSRFFDKALPLTMNGVLMIAIF